MQSSAADSDRCLNAVVQALAQCAAFREGLLRLDQRALQVCISLCCPCFSRGLLYCTAAMQRSLSRRLFLVSEAAADCKSTLQLRCAGSTFWACPECSSTSTLCSKRKYVMTNCSSGRLDTAARELAAPHVRHLYS